MSKGGFALLNLFYKADRMPSFDIRYSLFDIRFLSFFFDQTGWLLAASGLADTWHLFRTEAPNSVSHQ
jgi:hypothetical protein